MVKISFKTSGAAFHEDVSSFDLEVVRILRDIIEKIEDTGRAGGYVRDINGNTIGKWDLE
jgi:hypothetical protein